MFLYHLHVVWGLSPNCHVFGLVSCDGAWFDWDFEVGILLLFKMVQVKNYFHKGGPHPSTLLHLPNVWYDDLVYFIIKRF
jgi:hypothetical protein